MLTVVKVGGGLGDDALPAFCTALGELGARHPLIVVPGGAGFADAVRSIDLAQEVSGRTAVLLPGGLPVDGLPASWDVTSDSIAAWVADRVGAARLVLVKAVDGLFADWPPRGEPLARLTVAELAALPAGGVDEHLPAVLAGARFETWVIGGRDPARLAELLERGTTAGTRIAAGRLLPCRDG